MATTRTRSRGSQSAPSGARGRPRGSAAARRRKFLKRGFALSVAVGIGLVVGLMLSTGEFDRAILEVTLPLRHEDIIRQQASEKDVDPALIAAVIYAESKFGEGETSSAGARGLMQVQPRTALEIARKSRATTFHVSDLNDPDVNIRYGTYYLRDLLARYRQNQTAALAAYNAGPTNADSWGGAEMSLDDIPEGETRSYVSEVLDKQQEYRDKYPTELGY